MTAQFNEAETLDCMIVIGGEDLHHARSRHTRALYEHVRKEKRRFLPILISRCPTEVFGYGEYDSNLNLVKSLAVGSMAPDDVVRFVDKSKDVLGSMVFSRERIEDLRKKGVFNQDDSNFRVGIVTDPCYIDGAVWAAENVFGAQYGIVPLSTGKVGSNGDYFWAFVENFCLKSELEKFGAEAGDLKAHKTFLSERHPLYAKDAENIPFGMYALGRGVYLTFQKASLAHKCQKETFPKDDLGRKFEQYIKTHSGMDGTQAAK